MKDSGCCGASEFLKLWSYTLIDYYRVVHLDMDTIIYQNMVTITHSFDILSSIYYLLTFFITLFHHSLVCLFV